MRAEGSPKGESRNNVPVRKTPKNDGYMIVASNSLKENELRVRDEDRAQSCSPRFQSIVNPKEAPKVIPQSSGKHIQIGMDRYVRIPKRKLSPQKEKEKYAKSAKLSAAKTPENNRVAF